MALLNRIKFDGAGAECETCQIDAGPDETRCPRCGRSLTPRPWLVWKYPSEEIVLGSQLIVNQSQEAVLVKGGKALDVFGPGTNTLAAENVPLLSKLVNIPFGGQTPFSAEIYYVNRAARLDLPWGTPNPFQVMDPRFQVLVRVRAHGQVGVRIRQSVSFLTQLAGAMQPAQMSDYQLVARHFKGLVVSRVNDTVANLIVSDKVSVLEMTAHTETISTACSERVSAEFERFGIEVVNFFVESLTVPNEDLQKLKGALDDRAEFDILGDGRYTRKRTFDVLETGAAAVGEGGMSAGLGLGAGIGAGAALGGMLKDLAQQPPAAAGLKCAACGRENPAGTRFCGQCGAGLTPRPVACPSCRRENLTGDKFCVYCGVSLEARTCPACKAVTRPDTAFCGACGARLES